MTFSFILIYNLGKAEDMILIKNEFIPLWMSFSAEENILIVTACNKHLLNTYYEPGTVLRCLDEWAGFILTMLHGSHYSYFYFVGEKI